MPGRMHRLVAVSKGTCFIAAPMFPALSTAIRLLYLPIISAIRLMCISSCISLREVTSILIILSSPRMPIFVIVPPVKYLRKYIQKPGATGGFSFFSVVKCIRGFCGFVDMASDLFSPRARTETVISSFSGI